MHDSAEMNEQRQRCIVEAFEAQAERDAARLERDQLASILDGLDPKDGRSHAAVIQTNKVRAAQAALVAAGEWRPGESIAEAIARIAAELVKARATSCEDDIDEMCRLQGQRDEARAEVARVVSLANNRLCDLANLMHLPHIELVASPLLAKWSGPDA